MNGLDLFLEQSPDARRRVGLLAHAASLTREGQHAAEALSARGWKLIRLFCPEHGFFGRGAAGEKIDGTRHPALGLPIFSLYGEHRSPPASVLEDLDLMLIDLQDLGVRCYTYSSTLQNVLRACAAVHLPVHVLDRPTPLAGIEDGPQLDPALRCFVAQLDLPLVFGMSQGPLARHLQQSDPLLQSLSLNVTDASSSAQDLTWNPPSPGIVSRNSALLYPLTVWCEAIGNVRVDRGGPQSFQLWAMPDLPAEALAAELELPGISVKAGHEPGGWPALHFAVSDLHSLKPVTAAIRLLEALVRSLGPHRLFAYEGCRPDFFDKLMGTRSVRERLEG